MPGRPRLRTARTIACQGRAGIEDAMAGDRGGELALDQRLARAGAVGVAEPGPPAAGHVRDHQGGRRPGERAVGLRLVGGDLVDRRRDAVDDRAVPPARGNVWAVTTVNPGRLATALPGRALVPLTASRTASTPRLTAEPATRRPRRRRGARCDHGSGRRRSRARRGRCRAAGRRGCHRLLRPAGGRRARPSAASRTRSWPGSGRAAARRASGPGSSPPWTRPPSTPCGPGWSAAKTTPSAATSGW